jgi:hypothetical protein
MSRPWTVIVGCMVSFGIGRWDAGTALLVEESVEPAGFSVILVVIGMFPVIFAVAAFLRRRWGRLWLVVISALDVLMIPLVAVLDDEAIGSTDVESWLYAAASAVVVVLLLLPASNRWFRDPSAPLAVHNS